MTRLYFCVSAMFSDKMSVNLVKIKFVEMDREHKIWQDEVVSRFPCTKHFVLPTTWTGTAIAQKDAEMKYE